MLDTVTSFGELRRMTQFKDRAAEQDFVAAGLFDYPVLMAADILLYQAIVVPVGDDQRQHVELTRDIAVRFNERFGDTFVVPDAAIPRGGRAHMELQETDRLMSTTRGSPQGVVRVVDPPDVIRKKFKTAVTDSGTEVRHDRDEKPGISNLSIVSVATGEPVTELEARYDGSGYGAFKEDVGEAVVALFAPIQERYRAQGRRGGAPRHAAGAAKAREEAAPTLATMYERMGFVAPLGT